MNSTQRPRSRAKSGIRTAHVTSRTSPPSAAQSPTCPGPPTTPATLSSRRGALMGLLKQRPPFDHPPPLLSVTLPACKCTDASEASTRLKAAFTYRCAKPPLPQRLGRIHGKLALQHPAPPEQTHSYASPYGSFCQSNISRACPGSRRSARFTVHRDLQSSCRTSAFPRLALFRHAREHQIPGSLGSRLAPVQHPVDAR